MMKHFVIVVLVGFVGVSQAGVGVLTPAEEEDVLALYEKFCSNLRDEGPQIGDPNIYCKISPDTVNEVVNHEVILPGNSVGEQVVFIKPPPVTYKHNVQIQGDTGTGLKTKIYVLPGKSEHEISSQYEGGQTVTQKPTVYFLKNEAKSELSGFF